MAFDKDKWDKSYEHQAYQPSQSVTQAQQMLQQNMAQKPGAYQSAWQTQLNDTMNQIMNRQPFQYDLNGDALYKQYKDQYVNQGRMAMMDTMGQATALTGGYGNSYAQNAGQQAYQGYLQQLNNKIPELYNLALSKYQMEGNDLAQRYSMLSTQENQDYGRYQDAMNAWRSDRDYAAGRLDTERNLDLNQYNLDRDYGYNQFVNDRNYAYQQEQDRIAQDQWERQFAASQAAKASSGGGGGRGGSTTTTTPDYEALGIDPNKPETYGGQKVLSESQWNNNYDAYITFGKDNAGLDRGATQYSTYKKYLDGVNEYNEKVLKDKVKAGTKK